MPDWLSEWFSAFFNGTGIGIASNIWKAAMKAVTGVITTTPEDFSSDTWSLVEDKLYPWSLGIGLTVLNLFFMIAIWQAVKNFHQNITTEMIVEALVKIVAANILFINIMPFIKSFFDIAALMTGEVMTVKAPSLVVDDLDMASALFYLLLGTGFLLLSIICGGMILLTVYGRYIKLYLLVILAPLALPTLIGGQGVEHTFYAWLKTFLANVFEIVVIALALVLSFKLIQGGIDLFTADGALSSFDGGIQVINSALTMILVTMSVKTANSFLTRAMGL